MAQQILYIASVWILPVLIAITFHEAAHGWVAWHLGDPTAKMQGRVTFNPLRHIDPVGTVILPAVLVLMRAPILFGWAKPVPVDFRRLGNPRRDMVFVAAAGPLTNLLLAYLAALLLHTVPLLPGIAAQWVTDNLTNALIINLILAVFNMIPLPPLDGGRVAVGLLPDRLAVPLARLERYGLLIIVAMFIFAPYFGRRIGINLDIFRWIIMEPVDVLLRAIVLLAGLG